MSDRAIAFTITLLPNGISSNTASPSDFRRVSVRAINSLSARSASDVLALQATGFYVAEVCEEGRESLEHGASLVRARAAAAGAPPADMRGANTVPAAGGPYIPPPRAG